MIQRCVHGKEALDFPRKLATMDPTGDIRATLTANWSLLPDFFGLQYIKVAPELVKNYLVPLGPSSVIVEHIFAMTSLQRSCLKYESLIVSPPRITTESGRSILPLFKFSLYGTVELSQNSDAKLSKYMVIVQHYFGCDIPAMDIPDLQTFPKDN
ncbi:hypothetical protein Tco_0067471 [Tanacetum coccineum]